MTLNPVEIEIARNRLESIAEEVGMALIRTSSSPNIKDRRDCSAGLYLPDGELIAQAEHIPLHLGLMPTVIRNALAEYGTQRLRPGDVSGTDRLPYQPDDANLQANDDPDLDEGFEATGVDADHIAEFEMGLGRPRVLSDQGRTAAFKRWYEGDGGPKNQATRAAKANCSTCGYLMHMGGSARQLFGVCANEWSAFDGQVVSLDHGCGAHSETDVTPQGKVWDQTDPVLDDMDIIED